MENQLPQMGEVEKNLRAETRVQRVGFDTSELKAWDSGLLTFQSRALGHLSQDIAEALKALERQS